MSENKWINTQERLPDEGVFVHTKIDDAKGVRNEQTLLRRGKLFYTPDETMYVYYTPTHWRYANA